VLALLSRALFRAAAMPLFPAFSLLFLIRAKMPMLDESLSYASAPSTSILTCPAYILPPSYPPESPAYADASAAKFFLSAFSYPYYSADTSRRLMCTPLQRRFYRRAVPIAAHPRYALRFDASRRCYYCRLDAPIDA